MLLENEPLGHTRTQFQPGKVTVYCMKFYFLEVIKYDSYMTHKAVGKHRKTRVVQT